jgi:hypothetical protein
MLRGIKHMLFPANGKGELSACVAADSSPEVVEPKAAEPIERDILRDFSASLVAARKRVASIEEEVERLNLVVGEGAKVAQTLQNDIASDGGRSIAAMVTGGETPPAMASLIGIELAARAASARLPVAQAELADAKAASQRAEVENIKAVRNLLLIEATKKANEHRAAFDTLARLNEDMIGCSFGLPPTETLGQEIHNLVTPVEVPGFNLGAGSYSPTLRSIPDEGRIAKATARWNSARQALLDDPEADYLAILDRPAAPIVGIGSAPPGVTRGSKPATHVDSGTPVPGGLSAAATFVATQDALALGRLTR